jgi:UDP-N-acetylglucosamine acyltransferase
MIDIHPTSIIDPKAEIEDGVKIGPYSVIGAEVKIGRGTVIGSSVLIEGPTEIGENCKIYHGVSIGLPPQDLSHKGERSYVKIGNNNIIREFVTIHRATGEEKVTKIGDNNFLMAYVHIAHNCIVGSNTILVNMAQFAGFVEIGDHAFVSGMVVVHQYTRIGNYAMIGGFSRVSQDVPPFFLGVGNPLSMVGVNVVGLKRKGFSSERIEILREAFKIIYRSGLNTSQAIERIKKNLPANEDISLLLNFIETSKRGIVKKVSSGKGET